MFDELIGERIFLVKRDGHEKTGVLKEIAEGFLKIKFYDGREEIIALTEISTCKKSDR